METNITTKDVEHVALLARIELNDEEKEKLSQDLSEIIDYVDELNSAPTENVENITQISGLDNIASEDEIKPSLENDKVLQNAPDKDGNFIKVKKVFE